MRCDAPRGLANDDQQRASLEKVQLFEQAGAWEFANPSGGKNAAR